MSQLSFHLHTTVGGWVVPVTLHPVDDPRPPRTGPLGPWDADPLGVQGEHRELRGGQGACKKGEKSTG